MSDIKNCPFCGSKPELDYKNYWGEWIWEIRCLNCGCKTDAFDVMDECVEVWNMRVDE